MYVEEIISKLSEFWELHGLNSIPPIDTEVGAGTLHPGTSINAVVNDIFGQYYVQPCRRPDDNRDLLDGDRTSLHHQFQVIIKPYPKDSQEKYIQSLNHIGIKHTTHIIDFIGDNWQNPTIGAWGIGSEVQCNGTEISQLTYFKQVGGIEISPTPFEIAYGLERIALVLQKAKSILDVQWSSNVTIRDMLCISESDDYNAYGLSDFRANAEMLMNCHLNSARKLVEYKSLYPAYINCLKASNYFNILDSRLTFSRKKRQNKILEIRSIIFDVFKKYNEKNTNRNTL